MYCWRVFGTGAWEFESIVKGEGEGEGEVAFFSAKCCETAKME